MQNNYGGFQNRGNNSNMNSSNTMFMSSNFRNNQNNPNMNQNNNNFNLQNSSSNISLGQSQTILMNRNAKKFNVQLTPDEQNFYSKIYNMLDNNNSGRILGKPAANFMKKSNLPKQVLKEIWLIAAQSSNTFILREEFYVALRLIALAQNNMPFNEQSIEMNNPIPPLPNFDLNSNPNNNQNNFNQNNNNNNQNNFNQNNNNQDIYEIPDKEKAFFTNIFNNRKESNGERITAHNAIIIWKKNNADDNAIKIVANIIKPLENKGFLNLKEFIVACHLITISKKCDLPQKLPDTLVNFLGRNNNNMNINNFNTNSRSTSNTNITNFFNNNNNNNNNNNLNDTNFTIQSKQLANSPFENNNFNKNNNSSGDRMQDIMRKEEELMKKNNILNNQINSCKTKINDLLKEIELIQKRQDDINNDLRNLRQECNNLRNNGNSNNINFNFNNNNTNNTNTNTNNFISKNNDSNIPAKDSKKNLNALIKKNLENIGKNMRYDSSDLNNNNELNNNNNTNNNTNNITNNNTNNNTNNFSPQNNKNDGYPNLDNKKPDIMDLMDKMNLNVNNNNNNT